jgi:hypothetical protein
MTSFNLRHNTALQIDTKTLSYPTHPFPFSIVERVDISQDGTLKAFCDDYPEAKALFLYRGNETAIIDGIFCLPVEGFLRGLLPNNPIVQID